MSRIRTLRELMHEAAARSGEQYSIVYRSDAPVRRSEGVLRTGPSRKWRPPEWHERFHFARELAKEERQASRDRHRATIPGRERNVDLRPGRFDGDDNESHNLHPRQQ
jgi:hypothetical protein